MKLTIASEWASFEAATLGAMPAAARKMLRRAFYSGAMAMIGILADEGYAPDLALRARLAKELDDFMAGIASGEN